MLNDFFKRLLKWAMIAVCWVFIFSISWNGRTLFSHANEVLVQNKFVRIIDEEIGNLWYKLTKTAELTFNDNVQPEQQKEETW